LRCVDIILKCDGRTDGQTDGLTDASTMAKTRELHAVARRNVGLNSFQLSSGISQDFLLRILMTTCAKNYENGFKFTKKIVKNTLFFFSETVYERRLRRFDTATECHREIDKQ